MFLSLLPWLHSQQLCLLCARYLFGSRYLATIQRLPCTVLEALVLLPLTCQSPLATFWFPLYQSALTTRARQRPIVLLVQPLCAACPRCLFTLACRYRLFLVSTGRAHCHLHLRFPLLQHPSPVYFQHPLLRKVRQFPLTSFKVCEASAFINCVYLTKSFPQDLLKIHLDSQTSGSTLCFYYATTHYQSSLLETLLTASPCGT